jgi:hypothetical protein
MVPGYKVALGLTFPEADVARFLSSREAIVVAALVIAAVTVVILWRR